MRRGVGGGSCQVNMPVIFIPRPLCALKSLVADAFANKSKVPLLPINPEFEQITSVSYL